MSYLNFPIQVLIWVGLAFVTFSGALALMSPARFSVMARHGGKWFDTSGVVQKFDKSIDIDRHVLRHSRIFGAIILAAVVFVTYVYLTRAFGFPALF